MLDTHLPHSNTSRHPPSTLCTFHHPMTAAGQVADWKTNNATISNSINIMCVVTI